jgi:gas vesicle protein
MAMMRPMQLAFFLAAAVVVCAHGNDEIAARHEDLGDAMIRRLGKEAPGQVSQDLMKLIASIAREEQEDKQMGTWPPPRLGSTAGVAHKKWCKDAHRAGVKAWKKWDRDCDGGATCSFTKGDEEDKARRKLTQKEKWQEEQDKKLCEIRHNLFGAKAKANPSYCKGKFSLSGRFAPAHRKENRRACKSEGGHVCHDGDFTVVKTTDSRSSTFFNNALRFNLDFVIFVIKLFGPSLCQIFCKGWDAKAAHDSFKKIKNSKNAYGLNRGRACEASAFGRDKENKIRKGFEFPKEHFSHWLDTTEPQCKGPGAAWSPAQVMFGVPAKERELGEAQGAHVGVWRRRRRGRSFFQGIKHKVKQVKKKVVNKVKQVKKKVVNKVKQVKKKVMDKVKQVKEKISSWGKKMLMKLFQKLIVGKGEAVVTRVLEWVLTKVEKICLRCVAQLRKAGYVPLIAKRSLKVARLMLIDKKSFAYVRTTKIWNKLMMTFKSFADLSVGQFWLDWSKCGQMSGRIRIGGLRDQCSYWGPGIADPYMPTVITSEANGAQGFHKFPTTTQGNAFEMVFKKCGGVSKKSWDAQQEHLIPCSVSTNNVTGYKDWYQGLPWTKNICGRGCDKDHTGKVIESVCVAKMVWSLRECSTCCCKGGQAFKSVLSAKLDIAEPNSGCSAWFQAVELLANAFVGLAARLESFQWSWTCLKF